MTDSSQAVMWRAAHRPFGEVISVTGPASLDARFPGQWFQLESGLAYNWHRHYDASIGRYTQADPLGVKAGPSVYGYAGNGWPRLWAPTTNNPLASTSNLGGFGGRWLGIMAVGYLGYDLYRIGRCLF